MQELLRTGIYFCKLEVNLPIHQAMYLLKMEKFIVYRKHTKVYRQSVLVCRIRLERPMFQYSRDAKLVKEDIVVMDAIGVENAEENEKYNFLLSC